MLPYRYFNTNSNIAGEVLLVTISGISSIRVQVRHCMPTRKKEFANELKILRGGSLHGKEKRRCHIIYDAIIKMVIRLKVNGHLLL